MKPTDEANKKIQHEAVSSLRSSPSQPTRINVRIDKSPPHHSKSRPASRMPHKTKRSNKLKRIVYNPPRTNSLKPTNTSHVDAPTEQTVAVRYSQTFMQRVDDRFTKVEADIEDIKQLI